MVWNYQSKNTASYAQQAKNIATWDYEILSGSGWAYNQSDFTYNQTVDYTGSSVYYNTVGIGQTYIYQSKS